MDEKFGKVDKEFNSIDKRFTELTDIFVTKEDLKEATEKLATKEDFNNLLTAVDAYAHKADAYFQEMVALTHKVDRLEKWILQVAEKVGITLKA